MDQFNNNSNENVNAAESESERSASSGYTPLSAFAAKPSDTAPAAPTEEKPVYSQPVYEQPSYSRPEQASRAEHTPNYGAHAQPQYQPQPQQQPLQQAQPRPQQNPGNPYGSQDPAQSGASGYNYNQNSGEYRYVPPMAPHNNVPGTTTPPPPHRPDMGVGQPAAAGGKKEKSGRTFSTGAIVLIICACVLLSFGAGMLGAMLVGTGSVDSSGDPMVIYKNNDSKNDAAEDTVDDTSLVGVCAMVSDSVVEITTEYKTSYGNYQYVNEGAGSGVIISDNGYIITNNHVVTDTQSGDVADGVKVRLTDGTEYDAEVIGHDSDTDIAIIKIEAENLSAATVGDSDTLKVGEQVIAVGNPLGELGGTVTRGIISATNREISVDNNRMTLIQIDAAINPGNSGGGLFNMKGELIGVVNAKSTGVDVEGLGFAIPVNEAIDVAGELRTNGYVSGRTYIGISLTDVTDSFTAYYYFRSENAGVYISQVQDGYNDGVLKYGDRITAIDGDEVSSSQDVKDAVKSHKVGDKMKFAISRQGKLIEVEVTCYEYVPGGVSFRN